MLDLAEQIAQAKKSEIEELLNAVLDRYTALYPDWQVSTISLQKSSDRDTQLDRIIEMLQKMKQHSNC